MTTTTFDALSQDTIFKATKRIGKDVSRGAFGVAFAAVVGQALDSFASSVLRYLVRRLERDAMMIRGAASLVAEMNYERLIDPNRRGSDMLQKMERRVQELQADAINAQSNKSLPRTTTTYGRLAQVCELMRRSIVDLREAIAAHDGRVGSAAKSASELPQGGVYVLPDAQFEAFKECITSDREPTPRMQEVMRRYRTQVISK